MDFNSVKDKVAIVTGASSGIGKAIALIYAEHGMKVVCANRDPVKGQAVVDEIKAAGGEAAFIKTDASNTDEIKAMIDFAVTTYGRLDGIVNNAGIGMGGSPLHEFTLEDYEKIMNLNVKGVFTAMKYGAESIFKSQSKGGFIINVASIAGLMPQSGQSLYTATKFGVVGMTKSAALEYAPYNLTVNAICPGLTMTPIFGDASKEIMDYFVSSCPAGRMGNPEECAYLALFLASDMARYITGTAIPVDGALSAGARNIISWKHPEITTGEEVKISSDSTIAAIMENPEAAAIVEKYIPGFASNEQAKAAYGTTFKVLCDFPNSGISADDSKKLIEELDAFSAK